MQEEEKKRVEEGQKQTDKYDDGDDYADGHADVKHGADDHGHVHGDDEQDGKKANCARVIATERRK